MKGRRKEGEREEEGLGQILHSFPCHNSLRPTTLPVSQMGISEVNLRFATEGLMWLLGDFIV